MAIAIILASGLGKRMGAGKNKVLLTLGRKPIICHTITCFQKHDAVKSIVLVARSEEKAYFHKIIKKEGFDKAIALIDGGIERQHSAHNGLNFLRTRNTASDEIVLFHNGANPFVHDEEINIVIKNAKMYGAAAVAHRAKDTIKEVNEEGFVKSTLDRSVLWHMQTPQAIRFDLACTVFDHAAQKAHIGTDDVSLVELLGRTVKIVPASEENFKITTPRDLIVARMIMRARNL